MSKRNPNSSRLRGQTLVCFLFLACLQTTAARTLDDFDDGVKSGWTDFATGMGGAVTEAFGLLEFDVPAYLAQQPIFVASARAAERQSVQDGQTIDLRVDLAGANGTNIFAVLAWVPDTQPVSAFTGYFIAKSASEIRVGKALHKYFWREQPQPPLKNDNVTLALSLSLTNDTVTLRAQVLDKDAGNAMLFDQSFEDSPVAETLAGGTDDPAAPFIGDGQFVLMAYADDYKPGDTEIQQVSFDNAEVSTPAPTNLLPVIHDVMPTNTASFLPPDAKFQLLATDDKAFFPAGIAGFSGLGGGAQAVGVVPGTDGKTLEANVVATLAPNLEYRVRLVAVDSDGASNQMFLNFDTFCPADRVIEVEDYNFGGGQFFDLPTLNGYLGRAGVAETDYHVSNTNTAAWAYRLDTVPGRPSLDSLRPLFVDAGGPISNAFDYEVFNLGAGDYLNYTRTFAESDYTVYLREAVLNLDQAETVLERVTTDTSGNETNVVLGHFYGQRSGFEYRNVPLTDASGTPIKAHLRGLETLRLREVTPAPADGGISQNYIVFVTPVDICAVVESASDPAGPYAQDLTASMQGTTVTVKPLDQQARFFRIRGDTPLAITNLRRVGGSLLFDLQSF